MASIPIDVHADGAVDTTRNDVSLTFTTGAEALAIRAAVTGKRLRLVQAVFTIDQYSLVRFKDGTTGVADFKPLADAEFVLDLNPMGWAEASAGNALNVTCGAAGTILRGVFFVQELS